MGTKLKVAMMQPYFMPYIGYFQLINAVDKFIICDNIQYTKRGWFNRNRILDNGTDRTFTIPLKKDNRRVNVNQRFLANNSVKERTKILKQIRSMYSKAPYFQENFPIIRKPFLQEIDNLFDFIHFSIKVICDILDIKTEIIICSSIDMDHNLKAQERVIVTCNKVSADTYINPIGGQFLYQRDIFKDSGIELLFLKSLDIYYKQFECDFVPKLSIIDVLMFNSVAIVKGYLERFELI